MAVSKSVKGIAEALLHDDTLTAGISAVIGAEGAIDTIREDMFQRLAYHAQSVIDDFDGDVNTVMQVFKAFEKRYKKDKGLKVMPASYRSSKSVIINALRHGVELTNRDDDKAKGKTALERQIKVARQRGVSAASGAVLYYPEQAARMDKTTRDISNIRIDYSKSRLRGMSDEEVERLRVMTALLVTNATDLNETLAQVQKDRAGSSAV